MSQDLLRSTDHSAMENKSSQNFFNLTKNNNEGSLSPSRRFDSPNKRNDRRLGQSTLSFSSNEDKDKRGSSISQNMFQNRKPKNKNDEKHMTKAEFF